MILSLLHPTKQTKLTVTMDTFKKNIINIYKERGKVWLANLPKIVKKIAADWDLSDLQAVNNLSYHYVLSGRQDKKPIILKLYPEPNIANKEAQALETFANFGAVKILNKRDAALLLEHAIPGDSLKNYFPDQDKKATEIICKIITKLHQAPIPQNNNFISLTKLLEPIDKDWNKIPRSHLEQARKLKKHLLETSSEPVLLHGDLHHDNILANGKDWLVIDPKGYLGESAYEAAAFIRNPVPDLLSSPDPNKIILKRIASCADFLNLDQKRILRWCFVQSILSHIWCLEDNVDPRYFSKLSAILRNT